MPSEAPHPHDLTHDLTMRPATADDVPTLADLFVEARLAAYPAMPHSVHGSESVRSWFAEQLSPRPDGSPAPMETWLAEDGTEVLGYLMLDGSWLDALYVRAGRTGEGLGSLLLELAKTLRPEGFSLWVFETNVRAQVFYRHHGLVTIRRTDGATNEERSPDREMGWLGADPVVALRRRVDATDDEVADLLEQRAALTALIQEHKEVPGEAGRDAGREGEIAERMGARAPRLGAERMRRIMQAVITESLDAAAEPGRPDST